MHLIENYSLLTGLRIGRPYIYQSFFPLPFQKYITFQPYSKSAKNYDYWQQVIDIILPKLKERGIKIIQIGGKNEPMIDKTYYISGQTDVQQVAYLIKNSLLHFGVDSFGVHLASVFKRKIVALYSSMLSGECGPFWSDKDSVILFDSDKGVCKPSYANEENPKTINTIKPEKIAKSILDLLLIENSLEYETVFIGGNFHNRYLEVVPDSVTNLTGMNVNLLIVRADLHFNEEAVFKQLDLIPCVVTTKTPISVDRLIKNRERVKNVMYFIDESNLDKSFIEDLHEAGIPYTLFSYESGEALNDLKFRLLDFNPIIQKHKSSKKDFKEFEGADLNNLKFMSNRYLISKGKIHSCEASWRENKTLDKFERKWENIIDSPEFWNEVENFHVVATPRS